MKQQCTREILKNKQNNKKEVKRKSTLQMEYIKMSLKENPEIQREYRKRRYPGNPQAH